MPLSPAHRHFLLVEQSLVPALFNMVLNGAIAWLLMRHYAFLTLWDEGAVGPDLLITGFLLAFLSCAIVTQLIAGKIRKGEIPLLDASRVEATGLHQRSVWIRASVLGVVGLVVAAIPTIALLDWANVAPMSVAGFVTFKALWTGVLAAALTPVIAWWALLAASSDVQPA